MITGQKGACESCCLESFSMAAWRSPQGRLPLGLCLDIWSLVLILWDEYFSTTFSRCTHLSFGLPYRFSCTQTLLSGCFLKGQTVTEKAKNRTKQTKDTPKAPQAEAFFHVSGNLSSQTQPEAMPRAGKSSWCRPRSTWGWCFWWLG